MREKVSEKPYPIGIISEDIEVHFLHYSSFKEANDKWQERSKRINFDNLHFILTDRNGLTQEDAKRFDSLAYKNKVLLTVKEFSNVNCSLNLGENFSESIDNDVQLRDLCAFENRFTRRRYLDNFDFVGFLNKKEDFIE